MKRILMVLIMAAMLAATAVPAFAAENENASCVGDLFSDPTLDSTVKGPIISGFWAGPGWGPLVGQLLTKVPHSADCHFT